MTFRFVPGGRLLSGAALLASLLAGCNAGSDKTSADNVKQTSAAQPLQTGPWRGVLKTQGQEIPFRFEVAEEGGKQVVYLINQGLNGEERLRCDEIKAAGDSTTIKLHVFDAALVVRPAGEGKLTGTWVKYDAPEPYRIPLEAFKSEQLFPAQKEDWGKFAGTWNVTFKGDDGETYPAVGVFQQQGQNVTGTFLTSTGDYRYLAGQAAGDDLQMTTFDGNHGWLFTAKKQSDGSLKGHFYSGKSGHETWTARLDANAKLPDASALTNMKPGQKRLDFKFPNIYEGGSISPTDVKYKGKVVVVQVLGSWCPNCMDETNFLAPWYEQNKQRGVEIIGLGFERTPDQKAAAQRLFKMKERLKVGYDLAVAGTANKDSASKALPQLSKVLAFPTTIFLDKKGEVRKIHTGFSGPGTGKYYEQEKAEFNRTIDQLLAE